MCCLFESYPRGICYYLLEYLHLSGGKRIAKMAIDLSQLTIKVEYVIS